MSDIQLIHGDCLEVMKTLEAGSADAVVTDPLYNLGIDYGELVDDSRHDYSDWCASWLTELERICTGTIAISCGVTNLAMWYKLKEPLWQLCWHKSFSVSYGAFGFSNWEPVIIYGRTGRHGRWSDYFEATYVKDKGANGHPCPKPLQWGKMLLSIVSDADDTILDPFMGSGTTGVACVKTGRNFIGIEIDEGYYEIACKRVAEAQMQPRLM